MVMYSKDGLVVACGALDEQVVSFRMPNAGNMRSNPVFTKLINSSVT